MLAKQAKKYLYTVEYGDQDLLRKGDLNYNEVACGSSDDAARSDAAASYWSGDVHETEPPRVEVMVRRATVIASEEYSVPPTQQWADDDLPFPIGRDC